MIFGSKIVEDIKVTIVGYISLSLLWYLVIILWIFDSLWHCDCNDYIYECLLFYYDNVWLNTHNLGLWEPWVVIPSISRIWVWSWLIGMWFGLNVDVCCYLVLGWKSGGARRRPSKLVSKLFPYFWEVNCILRRRPSNFMLHLLPNLCVVWLLTLVNT